MEKKLIVKRRTRTRWRWTRLASKRAPKKTRAVEANSRTRHRTRRRRLPPRPKGKARRTPRRRLRRGASTTAPERQRCGRRREPDRVRRGGKPPAKVLGMLHACFPNGTPAVALPEAAVNAAGQRTSRPPRRAPAGRRRRDRLSGGAPQGGPGAQPGGRRRVARAGGAPRHDQGHGAQRRRQARTNLGAGRGVGGGTRRGAPAAGAAARVLRGCDAPARSDDERAAAHERSSLAAYELCQGGAAVPRRAAPADGARRRRARGAGRGARGVRQDAAIELVPGEWTYSAWAPRWRAKSARPPRRCSTGARRRGIERPGDLRGVLPDALLQGQAAAARARTRSSNPLGGARGGEGGARPAAGAGAGGRAARTEDPSPKDPARTPSRATESSPIPGHSPTRVRLWRRRSSTATTPRRSRVVPAARRISSPWWRTPRPTFPRTGPA